MSVSAKGEYACVAMFDLATHHGDPQPVRVKDIADRHGIPLRFLVQILLQLKGAGLVASTRGTSGGYLLTRAPEAISLLDIMRVVDPAPRARPTSLASTASTAVQAIRGVWQDIQADQQRRLEEITLADLVRQTQQPSNLSYQI